MKLERSRGTRDFLPEEQIIRQEIIDKLRTVFELYGYSPLESPALERFEVLSSKYAGGAEILKETFSLKDQGDRVLGLRYDLTVPLARIVGMNPQLKMPFKRYHIGDVWRDGPVATARYRQFLQCDVDVVGCRDMSADAEILCLARDVFLALGLAFKIKLNHRKIMNEILDHHKFPPSKHDEIILSIDKLQKFGAAAVRKELSEKGLDDDKIEVIMDSFVVSGSNEKKMSAVRQLLGNSEGVSETEELLGYLAEFSAEVEFDPSLARGLSYYTGPVYEVVLTKGEIDSSLAGGGRYDRIIGSFIGKGDYPATGISFGLDRIYDAYLVQKKKEKKTVAEVFVIPIKTFKKGFVIAQQLREAGIKADIDLMNRGPSKNLEYAHALKIPFVIFVGEEELKHKKVKLRNMATGEERLIPLPECIKELKAPLS